MIPDLWMNKVRRIGRKLGLSGPRDGVYVSERASMG